MSNYGDLVNKSAAPVTEKIDSKQNKNSAGGYVYEATTMNRLRRFLILGSDTGSYYAKPRELTFENYDNLLACLTADGKATVDEIVKISQSGVAPKNSPAIFAICIAMHLGDEKTRSYAATHMRSVCRTSTDMFEAADTLKKIGAGWGQAKKRAFREWYESKTPDQVAYQVAKYQSRNGRSHRDMLRLTKSHAEALQSVYAWVIKGEVSEATPALLRGFEEMKKVTKASDAAKLVAHYNLPHECVLTEFKKDPVVQMELLKKMPVFAMIRNLASYTQSGLFNKQDALNLVTSKLRDAEEIKKSRVHPFKIWTAMKQYSTGSTMQTSFTPNQQIVRALADAFDLSLKFINTSEKRILVGIDQSGSMMSATSFGASCFQCGLVMSYIISKKYPNAEFYFFDTNIKPANISGRSLADIMNIRADGGGTNCSLVSTKALELTKTGSVFDGVFCLTDSETWAGKHFSAGIDELRKKTPNTKTFLIPMVANIHSLTSQNHINDFEFVGLDPSAPELADSLMD